MNSEEKIIIAFLFKRSGKKEMTQSEFYLTLSMDLKWFTPKKAKDFTISSLKNNIILKKEDFLKPNFNINNIDIPLGFVPSKDVFYEQKEETKKRKFSRKGQHGNQYRSRPHILPKKVFYFLR